MKAIDLDCPKCHALAGCYCAGAALCQARINAAANASRALNRERKAAAMAGR